MKSEAKYRITFLVLACILAIFFAMDLFLGSVTISPAEVLNALSGNEDSIYRKIIIDFRLPKAITAVLTGMSLSICGMLMQTLFRNPLAGPYVLGISSGASLGVALVMMSGTLLGFEMSAFSGKIGVAFAACAGGFLSVLLILAISRKIKSNVTLLLVGIMIGHIAGAIQSVLEYITSAESLKGFVIWSMGSLGNITWEEMYIYFPVISIACLLSYTLAKPLNALLLGESYAFSLGVNVKITRLKIISITGILAGITTAFCGPIAFIGIAMPHICRLLFKTSDHRILITANLLCGAIALVLCDVICQLPGTGFVLPVNVATSLIGAPIVIWLILKHRTLS
ncbi:MAG: iron chelate uptake ABC transporter family permease subunit [Bacteroidia bacterium]